MADVFVSSVAEFKKGKVVFKQKPLAFESLSETMQEIVRFRDYVQSLNSPLSTVPQDHFPLIAKLVQESDKTLSVLAKSLLSLLFPANSSSSASTDTLVLRQAVEEAIKNVAERVNYGVTSKLEKVPSSCTIWRWEVKDFAWLPVSVRETALARLAQRKQAKEALQLCFDNFSEEERNTVLSKKSVQDSAVTTKEKADKKSLNTVKGKQESELTKKSAAAFANYFLKAKTTSQSRLNGSEAASLSNDFESTFKPFLVKKGIRMSPTNWFSFNQKNRNYDVIKIDSDVSEVCKNNGKDISRTWFSASLRSYFPTGVPSLYPVGNALLARRRFRMEHSYSVRSIVDRLNETELQGDQNSFRVLSATLQNRKLIPVKVFVFCENNRPGYLGTWTKTSAEVKPRRPFARDMKVFDYDFDSDGEWEVDESGEDVDSAEDSIEDDASSTASDLDPWLVDNDDTTEDIEELAEYSNVSNKKRQILHITEDKSHSKRRKVVPLVPFTKGPLWEKHLGICENDLFSQMRIQMFNDSPTPLSPFEFVSRAAIECNEVLLHNARNQRPDNISQPKSTKQNASSIPKTSFPDAHIETLLRKTCTINTGSLAVLIDILYQDLKSLGIKKNALELKLRDVMEKDKETKLWKVKELAWIQYGLRKPQ